jgi:transcriptional regulator with XRE-family HTH domain
MIVARRWTGREAAALRQARRMSMRAYAAHLGVAVATVSNWDSRGERARLNTETQQLLDIDLDRASDDVRERFAAMLASEDEDVNRRDFLASAGVATVGAFVSGDVPIANAAAESAQGLTNPRTKELTGPPLAEDLTAEVPRTIDPAMVDHFATLRALLVEADNQFGAIGVLPVARAQVAVIERFRQRARGGIRSRLLSSQARWVEFIGWLSDDLDDRVAGARLLDQAAGMAYEADDRQFAAFLLARKSQRALRVDAANRALVLADAAAKDKHAWPPVRAFASLCHGLAQAFDGDREGFERSVDHARMLVDQCSVQQGELGSFCNAGYVLMQEGEGWLRLGEPAAAAGSFSRAVGSWPAPYWRERGLCLARSAVAHFGANQPDEAAHAATQALAMASKAGSTRLQTELATVALMVDRYRDAHAVQDLRAALAEADR